VPTCTSSRSTTGTRGRGLLHHAPPPGTPPFPLPPPPLLTQMHPRYTPLCHLYEFQKYNKDSGERSTSHLYSSHPHSLVSHSCLLFFCNAQRIAKQVLGALRFMHSLGLIHCDLKPENILIKSYSRCEVKVIDLGSSCFETDHLCTYVQSRSYRAPEVILGLPYGPKIDIWSLGCILAELCSGQVSYASSLLPFVQ